jgi:hypothetical protein
VSEQLRLPPERKYQSRAALHGAKFAAGLLCEIAQITRAVIRHRVMLLFYAAVSRSRDTQAACERSRARVGSVRWRCAAASDRDPSGRKPSDRRRVLEQRSIFYTAGDRKKKPYQRCIKWRDDGSRASRALRSDSGSLRA